MTYSTYWDEVTKGDAEALASISDAPVNPEPVSYAAANVSPEQSDRAYPVMKAKAQAIAQAENDDYRNEFDKSDDARPIPVTGVVDPKPVAPTFKTSGSAADFRETFKAKLKAGDKSFTWTRPDGSTYQVAVKLAAAPAKAKTQAPVAVAAPATQTPAPVAVASREPTSYGSVGNMIRQTREADKTIKGVRDDKTEPAPTAKAERQIMHIDPAELGKNNILMGRK